MCENHPVRWLWEDKPSCFLSGFHHITGTAPRGFFQKERRAVAHIIPSPASPGSGSATKSAGAHGGPRSGRGQPLARPCWFRQNRLSEHKCIKTSCPCINLSSKTARRHVFLFFIPFHPRQMSVRPQTTVISKYHPQDCVLPL